MFRRGKSIISILFFVLLVSFNSFAQSGRGRQPTAPPPKPRPNTPVTTVLGIPEGGKLVKQDLDGATSRYILRNGLTIIIRERHSVPLVSINVAVKAGYVNESDEIAGMARLARQMILRGTAKRPGAAVQREVARLGGVFTSDIDYDRTCFNVTAPAESYQAAIELLADLIARPAYNAEELKKAAQSVILESRYEQDQVDRASLDKLFSTAFAANRLKRGATVSETMLAGVTREQAISFYHHYYHPANTIITIVGDIFSLQALGQAQLNFGAFAKVSTAAAKPAAAARSAARTAVAASTEPAAAVQTPQDPFSPNPEEPAQDKLRYANSRADIGQSLVTIGYRTPALKADKDGLKEMATLQALSAILGLGNGSRLNQGLREGLASRDKLSVAIETGFDHLNLPGSGMLVAKLRVDPDRIDRAEAEYFREIERFRRELVSDGELQRARVMLEKRHYDRISQIESETAILARYQAQFGDYRLYDSSLSRIRTVTAQDIQQAAAKYLTLANVTIHEYEPRNAQARIFTPEKFAELVVTFAAGAAQPIKPEEVKQSIALKTFVQGSERAQAAEGQNVIVASIPLPIKDFSVLRGPRAYVREDKSLPVLTISVLFQGGRLTEDGTTSGTTELMLNSMLKSTTTRKAELIAHELESYGGEIHVINEPDFFGFTLDVLSRNAETAVKLMLDIIENPFFDKDEVARERNVMITRQQERRDDEVARSIELMWASLYPDHPYGLSRYGTPEITRSLNEEKLEAWHASTIKKQFPMVILVGDTDGSSLVSRIFSDALRRDELDKSIKVNIPTTLPTPQDKIEQRSRLLTSQTIGYRLFGQTLTGQSDIFALDMLEQIASSGKLLEELRDNLGLAEQLNFRLEQRLASGAVFAQFLTLPENEQRGREAVQAELLRLASAPPTDDEFEQGRNASIGRYAISLQSHRERALEYARSIIFSRKPSDVETQPDFVRAVKKTDIKRLAENVIKPNQMGRGAVRGEAANKN